MSRKKKRNTRSPRQDPEQPAEDGPPRPLWRRIWDQVGPLGFAVLIALGIRAVVIESYYVPSESMLPTLLVGDHVFVNKFAYGARIPFTGIHLPALRDPERGDLVVFGLGREAHRICPLDECPDAREEGFVKRIVATPGDVVEYREGVFYLNGAATTGPQTGATFTDVHGRALVVRGEDIAGCVHEVLQTPGAGARDLPPFEVPEGRYFVMGDNRDNSNDSRVWGTVPRTDLRGPVIINYWSWNNWETWGAMLNPLTWADLLANEMRWDRIGMDYDCRDE